MRLSSFNYFRFGHPERQLARVLLYVLAFFALVAACFAQPQHPINPQTQIAWPSNCTGTTPLYNIVTHQCVAATGTAANPAGSTGQLQQNIGGNFAGVGGQDAKGIPYLTVNSEINVLSYGAKGDCLTDDHNAIVAAQTAAETYASAQAGPAALYFPKPAGGCYLTSTVAWHGVSLIGQQVGIGDLTEAKWTVNIRGMPGQDIFQAPDPSLVSVSYPWFHSWTITGITFQVDGGTPATYLHRWPGRWSDQTNTTNGSTSITTSSNMFSCADVGEAIQINGAGTAGGNLVTTVASVDPCWSTGSSWQKVTLAAPAQATLANAHAYISLLGLPVTSVIGNCAIAMPNYDAKISDWTVPTQDYGANGNVMENVTFSNVHANGTNTCGMFTQGLTTPYQFGVKNVNFNGLIYGVVQGASELNSHEAASGNDFQTWDHVWMFTTKYPWISVNGLNNKLTNWQMSAQSGIQILGLDNRTFDCPCGWTLGLGSFEIPSGTTGYGTRIEGSDFIFLGGSIGTTGTTSWINGTSNRGKIGPGQGTINIGAQGAELDFGWDNMSVVDKGRGNVLHSNYNPSGTWGGEQLTYPRTYVPYKGESRMSGRITANSIRDGNNSIFYNWDDLMIWPQDFLLFPGALPYSSLLIPDSLSPSGSEWLLQNTILPFQFSQFPATSSHLLVGSTIPAGKTQVYYMAKCAAAVGNFTLNIKTNTNAVPASDTQACTTTLTRYSFVADLSSVSGQYIGFIPNTSTNIYLAWISFRPFVVDVNGKTIPGAGPTLATGPATSVSHNCPWFTDTIGTMGDSGSPCGASGAPTYYNVVTQSSFDNTGVTQEGAATATLLTTQPTLFFPIGTYNVNDGINLACTSSTCSGYRIIGAGRDKTILKATTCTNGYVLWYNNTTNSGDNFKGMRLEHLTIDVSSAGTSCTDGVKYTQTALTVMDDVAILGAGSSSGAVYSTGTIGITGSTVTGVGTVFNSAMVPGILQVSVGGQTMMAEIGTFNSSTSLTLNSSWPSGTVATGTAYALTYGGRAITCDPGNSFSQYGSFHDVYIQNFRFPYYFMGTGSGSNGCSRFTIDGSAGWIGWSGTRGANSIGIVAGKHTDTLHVRIPINNFARGVLLDSAHANDLDGMDIENNSSQTVVSTCNGGVAAQSCLTAVEVGADAQSTGYGNHIRNLYPYLNGTVYQIDNINGAYNMLIEGLRSASFSNTTNYFLNGNTGCPANGSAATVGQISIQTWDCFHTQVANTVN